MEILYVGLLFEKDKQNELLKISHAGVPNACNILQWNFIDAIETQLQEEVSIISSLPLGNYPKLSSKFLIKTHKWKRKSGQNNNIEVGFINFFFVKHFYRKIVIWKFIKNWIEKKLQDKKKIKVIFYDIYLPFLEIAKKLKREYKSKIEICFIIADLRGEFAYDNGLKGIMKKINSYRDSRALKLASIADKYVLITKEMAKAINVENKPYIVLEGIAKEDDRKISYLCEKEQNRVIMYAGGLSEQYGIKQLIQAFEKIVDPKFQLWICGRGELEDYIRNYERKDERIHYYGYVTKETIYELEKKVTVFINPRPNNGIYTQYSFPSKIMENMLAGRPVIAYKLDGIPEEYDSFLHYIKDNSAEAIKEAILEVCNKSIGEINKEGERNRRFIIENKNYNVQAKKIMELLNCDDKGNK